MAEHGDELRIAVATLRSDHGALVGRVTAVEGAVNGLHADLDSKHRENRKSIHAIRGSQQDIVDALHNLDLKFAKFTGYAIGAGAVIALLMKALDVLIK